MHCHYYNWIDTKLDYWLQMLQRKLLGWKLCKPGLIREDNGIPKLHMLAYHLWPPLLSALNVLNVERAKKWLPSSSSTAIPKGGHGDIGQQFLGSSQPFWPHQLQLFENFVPQISWWQHGKSSELAVDDLGVVKCFPCLHSWIAPTVHQHSVHCGEWNLEVFCYLPVT